MKKVTYCDTLKFVSRHAEEWGIKDTGSIIKEADYLMNHLYEYAELERCTEGSR